MQVPLKMRFCFVFLVIQFGFITPGFSHRTSHRFVEESPNLSISARKAWILRRTIEFHKDSISPQDRMDKFRKMTLNPSAFLRGNAYLFYAEVGDGISAIPMDWLKRSGLQSWISGDAHMQNLGFYESEGELLFDLNDFDEACVGSIFFDLIRFLVSIRIMCERFSFKIENKDFHHLTSIFIDFYKTELLSNRSQEITLDRLDGFLRSQAERIWKKNSAKKQIKKWCKQSDKDLKFKEIPNKLVNLNPEERLSFFTEWESYLQNSSIHHGLGLQVHLLDAKKRIGSGLGSLGKLKIYALVRKEDDEISENQLLEIKEQSPASAYMAMTAEQYLWHRARFSNEGERVFSAFKVFRPKLEPLSGVILNSHSGSLMRRISPWSKSINAESISSRRDLENLLKFSAQVLAQAHLKGAKSLNQLDNFRVEVSAFLDSAVMQKVSVLVRKMASSVYQDYKLFHSLLREGSLGRSLNPPDRDPKQVAP